MTDSPPPFPKVPARPTRERSPLDQIKDSSARAADAAEAAARRAKRIEAAIGDLAVQIANRSPSSMPPRQLPYRERELSYADDSQRIDLPNLPIAVDHVLDERELKAMRSRQQTFWNTVIGIGSGAAGIGLWELIKWLIHR